MVTKQECSDSHRDDVYLYAPFQLCDCPVCGRPISVQHLRERSK